MSKISFLFLFLGCQKTVGAVDTLNASLPGFYGPLKVPGKSRGFAVSEASLSTYPSRDMLGVFLNFLARLCFVIIDHVEFYLSVNVSRLIFLYMTF